MAQYTVHVQTGVKDEKEFIFKKFLASASLLADMKISDRTIKFGVFGRILGAPTYVFAKEEGDLFRIIQEMGAQHVMSWALYKRGTNVSVVSSCHAYPSAVVELGVNAFSITTAEDCWNILKSLSPLEE